MTILDSHDGEHKVTGPVIIYWVDSSLQTCNSHIRFMSPERTNESEMGCLVCFSSGVHWISVASFWVWLWSVPCGYRAPQVVLVVENLPASAGDLRGMGLIPGLVRFPGGGHGNPHRYSCLENPTDRGAWRAAVHGVAKSQAWLKWLSMHTHMWVTGTNDQNSWILGCLCFKYLIHLTDLLGLAPSLWGSQTLKGMEDFWEQTPGSPNRRLREHSSIDSPFLPEGFPDGSVGTESICNTRDPCLIPGSGSSIGEGIDYPLQYSWACLVSELVKNLPATQETWVWSLGWEDPLEKETATHSSILAWRIPWTVYPCGCKESDTTERLSLFSLMESYSISFLVLMTFTSSLSLPLLSGPSLPAFLFSFLSLPPCPPPPPQTLLLFTLIHLGIPSRCQALVLGAEF